MGSVKHSKIYTGNVAHKRYEPFEHGFNYKLYMAFIDLDEVDSLLKDSFLFSSHHKALVEFRRSDYLGNPDIPLHVAVRDKVFSETGVYPRGPIRMLTHLRTFGYIFNPVTFYYCYDEEDQGVEYIVAEITNTPWKERHAYVLEPGQNLSREEGWYRYRVNKDFHVSPFMDMNYTYDMQFKIPDEKLNVQITNMRDNGRKFIAVLNMSEEAFLLKNLVKVLIRYPFMTIKVITAIHWQALKLKLKGANYYPNPGRNKKPAYKEAA